jgi:hypothetical protein
MEDEKPKIRFVKDLKFVAEAMCLPWIDEIHIDESHRNSPILNDIIKHEKKHYLLYQKMRSSESSWKVFLLREYNTWWDLYDCTRLDFLQYYRQPFSKKITSFDLWLFVGFVLGTIALKIWGFV